MKALMGMDAFRTHIDTKKNVNNVAPFYWTIFKNWNSIYDISKTPLDPFGIRRQRIWLNKYIKINKQEIWWKNWSEKGILIIHDIIDENGNFLSINNLEQRYDFKCNFLQYNSIKDAIPKEWRNNVKKITIHRDVISSDESIYVNINKQTIPLHKINNQLIYWKLIEEIRICPITKNKWIDELNLNEDRWERIFEISKVTRETKIRAFQYKLLFNLTPCNLYLYRIGKSNIFKCNYCNAVDNIIHYFYECVNTKLFWKTLQNWWNILETDNLIMDKTKALVGILEKGANMDKLNFCLLLARWYIYIEKLNLQEPFFYKFVCLFKHKLKLERMISQRNDALEPFIKIWGTIEENLD
jgi:hypothetical protein